MTGRAVGSRKAVLQKTKGPGARLRGLSVGLIAERMWVGDRRFAVNRQLAKDVFPS